MVGVHSHNNRNVSKVWWVVLMTCFAIVWIGHYTYASLEEIARNTAYVADIEPISIRDIRTN